MSIYFMFDCHMFQRLDTMPVDEAMDLLEECVEHDGGGGFIGGKGEHDQMETFQWHKGEPWRVKVRKILKEGKK